MHYQIDRFLPPPFPIPLIYTKSGDGIQLPPESPPVGAAPGAYQKERHYDRITIEDTRIRLSIERALLADEESITEMSKFVAEAIGEGVIQELGSVSLQYPNSMPHVEESGRTNLGNNNDSLKHFAFSVFDILDTHYKRKRWGDWCIVPYFQEGDDMHNLIRLGVFVPQNFAQTVVE